MSTPAGPKHCNAHGYAHQDGAVHHVAADGVTVEDMLADDPELTEADFEDCFDRDSDERLERSRGLDY